MPPRKKFSSISHDSFGKDGNAFVVNVGVFVPCGNPFQYICARNDVEVITHPLQRHVTRGAEGRRRQTETRAGWPWCVARMRKLTVGNAAARRPRSHSTVEVLDYPSDLKPPHACHILCEAHTARGKSITTRHRGTISL